MVQSGHHTSVINGVMGSQIAEDKWVSGVITYNSYKWSYYPYHSLCDQVKMAPSCSSSTGRGEPMCFFFLMFFCGSQKCLCSIDH